MTPASVLISTVGVSLDSNLSRPDVGEDLLTAYAAGDTDQVVRLLRGHEPTERLCGAEVNTTTLLSRTGGPVSTDARLHFCVAETQKGTRVADILRRYYGAERTTIHVIGGLQDQDPEKFRRQGLLNLIRKMGEIIRSAGAPEYVAINATGGYKAQIAMAVLLGQALGVLVYYMHENFSSIISFPPMPISLDFALLGEHSALLDLLERDGDQALPNEFELDPRLEAFVETQLIDGHLLAALSPVGQVFLEGYRLRYPALLTLPPAALDVDRQPPSFPQHHYASDFKQYVEKVWRESEYIKHCRSADYSKQKGIRDREFYLRPSGAEEEIVGDFKDHASFGARFVLQTTAVSHTQRLAVVQDLTRRFSNHTIKP